MSVSESRRESAARKQSVIDHDLTQLRNSVNHYIPDEMLKRFEIAQAIDLLQAMIDNAITAEQYANHSWCGTEHDDRPCPNDAR